MRASSLRQRQQKKVAPRLLLTLLVIAPGVATGAVVQSCRGADGSLHFVQFACPNDTEPASRPGEGLLNVVAGSALTAEEARALATLEQSLLQERAQRRRSRERAQTAQQQARARTAAQCREAERALDALSAQRRRGYSAAEAGRLDAAERRWNRQRRETC